MTRVIGQDREDLTVLHQNRLPARAAFVAAADEPAALRQGNVGSRGTDRCLLLNGEWDFRFYPDARLIPNAVWQETIGWDTTPVPSVWQQFGYEPWHYVNVKFPFPAIPPRVPTFCPAGVYRRHFDYDPLPDGRGILTFHGVDAAFEVWLNGQFLGYSQGSHFTAEFDATPLLRTGDNLLCVIVFKWCWSSYLECQDKFRCSGIFRDVTLTRTFDGGLWDLRAVPQRKNADEWMLETEALPLGGGQPGAELTLTLYDPDGQALLTRTRPFDGSTKQTFHLTTPALWTAETPALYTLTACVTVCGDVREAVSLPVGFVEITTDGGVFRVNGTPVKLKGVNRHDTHPRRGPAVTLDEIRQDLLLMKQFGVNALR